MDFAVWNRFCNASKEICEGRITVIFAVDSAVWNNVIGAHVVISLFLAPLFAFPDYINRIIWKQESYRC